MDVAPEATWVRAWKPGVAGIREVFHARFAEHAYPVHTHDVWTLFIVDDGAIRYDLHRRQHGAGRFSASILPPHVAHDGRPHGSEGFRKRVIYLEVSVLGEGLIGPAADAPDLVDPLMRQRVSALNDALASPDDALEAEARLAFVVERVSSLLGGRSPEQPIQAAASRAGHLRGYLDEHLFEPATIASAAARLDVTTSQLTRAFTAEYGLPPHAYVLGRRLELARDRILRGQPLADVAAELGFTDQAHFTRRFKRFLGTTPGSFRRARWS